MVLELGAAPRTLVNIVKYCNEPEVGLVLIDKL